MCTFATTMTDKAIQNLIKSSRKSFSKRIIVMRGKETQEEFALRATIDPRTLQNIEAGKEPRFSTMVRMCSGLKITMSELTKGV